jgi:uroporphyrin-III C-methyltransferase/precorrin-2 dehydrogenase/sirohydrochlorin ferrochelatase
LKGGDPGIFAHGAEEIEVARRLNVPYQIVPGISAANGCAAFSGIPLTERDGAKGVRFLTLYTKTLHQTDFWEGLRYAQNETLVFYMSTPHYVLLCEKLQAVGYHPDTPVMVVEQGTTPATPRLRLHPRAFRCRFRRTSLYFPQPDHRRRCRALAGNKRMEGGV